MNPAAVPVHHALRAECPSAGCQTRASQTDFGPRFESSEGVSSLEPSPFSPLLKHDVKVNCSRGELLWKGRIFLALPELPWSATPCWDVRYDRKVGTHASRA